MYISEEDLKKLSRCILKLMDLIKYMINTLPIIGLMCKNEIENTLTQVDDTVDEVFEKLGVSIKEE